MCTECIHFIYLFIFFCNTRKNPYLHMCTHGWIAWSCSASVFTGGYLYFLENINVYLIRSPFLSRQEQVPIQITRATKQAQMDRWRI